MDSMVHGVTKSRTWLSDFYLTLDTWIKILNLLEGKELSIFDAAIKIINHYVVLASHVNSFFLI